jgi:hypothetical membrane protein
MAARRIAKRRSLVAAPAAKRAHLRVVGFVLSFQANTTGGPLSSPRTRDRITLAALAVAVAIPFLYYGIQLLCAAFEPDYSFIRQAASELGSDRAARPQWFNAGIMVQGVVTLVAAPGFLRAMWRLGVHPILALLVAAALAVNGVHTMWAGYFPMPDPRHGGHLAFIIAMTALPILLTAALWQGSGPLLKAYFLATLVLLLAMVPVMSNKIGVDTTHIRGLRQRVFTLTVFPPIAVSACVLARRLRRLPD